MITFGKVDIENIIYFKKESFDLGYEGITFITGDNRNASVKGRRNGAGKTLLASAILGILYPDVINSNDLGKKQKHSLFQKSNSSLEWTFTKDDQSYKIKKYKDKSTIKWDIFKGDENLNPRSISSIAEKVLPQIFPLTSEDFFTTVYLTSRRMNLLQLGTPTQRLHYFTNLFRLNDFETVKQYFQNLIKDLASSRNKKEVYVEMLAPLIWVKSFDIKGKTKLLDNLVIAKDKYLKELPNLARIQKNFDLYLRFKDDFKKSKLFSKHLYRKMLSDKKQLEAYNSYKEALKEYDKANAKYLSDLEIIKSFGCTTSKEYSNYCKEQYKLEENLRIQYENWVELKEEWDDYESNKTKARKIKKEISTYKKTKSIEVLEQLIDQYTEQLDNLDLLKQSKCPVCNSKLDKKTKSLLTKSIKASLKSLNKDLKIALKVNELNNELIYLDITKPKKLEDKPKKLKLKLPSVKLNKPKKPNVVNKPNTVDEDIFKLQKSYKKSKERCEGISLDILKGTNLRDTSKETSKLTKKLMMCEKDIATLESEVKRYHEDFETYTDVSNKIKKITKSLKDADLFHDLVEAYSNKGLKLLVMSSICTYIQDNLNKYTSLLFPEHITFKMEVDVNTFNITARRKDGTESDIRELSGAESTAFSLLWLLSILPLIPTTRRLNILVLDEFESGLDEPTRKLLIEEFLPMLKTIVPHIIFITPYKEISVPNSRVVCCTKKGSSTTLETKL